ncbi:MAG: VIT domain-containing protein [Myxococcota bacterium]
MARISALFFLAPLLISSRASASLAEEGATGAPYFLVPDATSSLVLDDVTAHVEISAHVAQVHLVQRYRNPSHRRVDALYVFPASTRAAVHDMTMTVGDRVLKAEVQERGVARDTFENARRAGHTASLLQQYRPNVFQMEVGNIPALGTVLVELDYVEELLFHDDTYEFVLPGVVGPRYGGEASGPYERALDAPNLPLVRAQVRLSAGMPIREVQSSTHRITVRHAQDADDVELLEPVGQRDFVLRYRLTQDAPRAGVLRYQDEDGGHLLLSVQPPELSSEGLAPREYLFVLDTSGSMGGQPAEIAEELMLALLGNLREDDWFNVVFFDSTVRLLSSESLGVTPESVSAAMERVASEYGGGGTNVLHALRAAVDLPRPRVEGLSRSLILVTDGLVTVDREAVELLRSHPGVDNVFAFGAGHRVNRHLIEELGRVGRGEAFVAATLPDAHEQVRRFRNIVEAPVLTDVQVRFEGLEVQDVDPEVLPDLFAHRPLFVTARYRAGATGTVVVRGRAGQRTWEQRIALTRDDESSHHGAVKYLWARRRIAALTDQVSISNSAAAKREATDLAQRYNLASEYTSFVAVDDAVVQPPEATHPPPHVLKPTIIDFSGATIEGERARAEGSHLVDCRRSAFRSLVSPRTDFEAELLASAPAVVAVEPSPPVRLRVVSVAGASATDVERVLLPVAEALHRALGRPQRAELEVVLDENGEVAAVHHPTRADALRRILQRVRWPRTGKHVVIRVELKR